jgi:hypothetical protein
MRSGDVDGGSGSKRSLASVMAQLAAGRGLHSSTFRLTVSTFCWSR